MGQSLLLERAGLSATLARFPTKVEEGRNVSHRGYPVTTAFSSLNPGIGGIDSVILEERLRNNTCDKHGAPLLTDERMERSIFGLLEEAESIVF